MRWNEWIDWIDRLNRFVVTLEQYRIEIQTCDRIGILPNYYRIQFSSSLIVWEQGYQRNQLLEGLGISFDR